MDELIARLERKFHGPDMLTMADRYDAATALRAYAEREKELVEALEPFAALADRYDPPEGDDAHAPWDQTALPTLGDFRHARAILSSTRSSHDIRRKA